MTGGDLPVTGADLLALLGVAVVAGTLIAVMHKEPPRQALRYAWMIVKIIVGTTLAVWFLARVIHGR